MTIFNVNRSLGILGITIQTSSIVYTHHIRGHFQREHSVDPIDLIWEHM